MRDVDSFVDSALRRGETPPQIWAQLTSVGWSSADANSTILSRLATRSRGIALLIGSVAAGVIPPLYGLAVLGVVLGPVWSGDYREAIDPSRSLAGPTFLYVLVAGALWVVSVALLIVHLSSTGKTWKSIRTLPTLDRSLRRDKIARAWLLVFSWIFAIGNVLVILAVPVIVGTVLVALGVMCGEAVSESCGL